MRILYLSQYFPPEAGATQSRAYEMAHQWVQMNHSVTMISEFPNHPSGIMPQKYNGKLFEKSNLDGIDVIRVWVKASPVKNFLSRMLFYLSYMVNAIIIGLFVLRGRYDLLYATSPPLFVGGAALLLSYLKQIPLVFEVRDLWPESAVALGELTNKLSISIATRLEEMCYRKAIQIVVVTQGVYNKLIQRCIPQDKLFVTPNGANTDLFFYNFSDREKIRKELGLSDKFIVIYAGIHGLAQNLETLLLTARELVDQPKIHFLMIGEGPKKSELMTIASSYILPNLTFLPEKPRELIPMYLSAADISVIPLRNAKVFDTVIPSKIFDAWACRRPVLLTINGEARELVETIKGGIFVPPEDSNKMADVILKFQNSPVELDMMGNNGYEYTQQNHSRKALAENLITYLEKLV
jgi:glycosyltransferase involved in cell wall biosynthesis